MTSHHLTLITGASRGMGLAMARQLLASGHTVLAISRQTSAELAASTDAPASLTQWTHDLSDSAALVPRLQAWLAEQPGTPWHSVTLINNAGVIPKVGPLDDADGADLARAIRVGLEAPLVLTAAFLQATADWKSTRKVLNISSGLGRRPMASQAAYCAAKAGMDLFTRCLALEEAAKPNGAKVCALAPGVIDTDMQAQLRAAAPDAFPDRGNFVRLKDGGQLTSPEAAASRVLAWLVRADFGADVIADARG